MILECLEIALQAPTGSFSQGWSWMFVEDPDKKRAIADYYGANFDAYREQSRLAASSPTATCGPSAATPIRSSSDYLRSTSTRSRAVDPAHRGTPRRTARCSAPPARGARSCPPCGASCWPCASAASARRGPRCTCPNEREVAELLGIPYDRYTQAGLFPIAYTIGTDFKPAPRLGVDELVHWDTW